MMNKRLLWFEVISLTFYFFVMSYFINLSLVWYGYIFVGLFVFGVSWFLVMTFTILTLKNDEDDSC